MSNDPAFLTAMIVLVIQVGMTLVGWSIKRSINEFDKHNAVQDERLNNHARSLTDIEKHIARVEEYMSNAKLCRQERSDQLNSLTKKIDLISHEILKNNQN